MTAGSPQERRRREQLDRRVNELVEDNRRSRELALEQMPERVAQKATVQRVLEIVERHRLEWISQSEGAKPLAVGSHACVLIADEIVREFGETK